MATPISKCSLDSMLQSILSVGNSEQNATYPPSIYSAQFNVTTSLLLSKLAEVYPEKPAVLDMISSFVQVKRYFITNGFIQLDDDYRNILGAPSVVVRNSKDGECEASPPITNAQEFQVAQLKGGCTRRPIRVVPQSEFDYRTTSGYKKPTFWDPIGYWAGPRTIKVCPFDLSKVDILYVRKEKTYVYGYITQPDDTFIFDPNTSVESEWESSAFEPIFKAMVSLYSIYTRDQEVKDWATYLHERGIL